jgi:hypothetical protein
MLSSALSTRIPSMAAIAEGEMVCANVFIAMLQGILEWLNELSEGDGLLKLMHRFNIPITRENYLDLALHGRRASRADINNAQLGGP